MHQKLDGAMHPEKGAALIATSPSSNTHSTTPNGPAIVRISTQRSWSGRP